MPQVISPEVIQSVVKFFGGLQLKNLQPGKNPASRAVHAGTIAFLEATVTVEDNLPPEYRQGLFQQPGTYKARIRYSNGSSDPNYSDAAPGPTGMALEVALPDGTVVHLLANDDPVFFFSNANDLNDAVNDPKAFFMNLEKPRVRELAAIARGLTFKKAHNPGRTRYYSQTPYSFGKGACKFSFIPENPECFFSLPSFSHNCKREALAEDLKNGTVKFKLAVQLLKDPDRQPIDDALTEWDEQLYPFVPVATIEVLQQEITTKAITDANRWCFNPYNCHPDMRPLGSINELRLHEYNASQRYRFRMNGWTLPKQPVLPFEK